MALKKYLRHFFIVIYLHSVQPLCTGGLNLLQNFQNGGLTGSQFLEGSCWKRGGTFSAGVREGVELQFLHKK